MALDEVGNAPLESTEAVCRICDHVISVSRTRERLLKEVAMHFEDDHSGVLLDDIALIEARAANEPGHFETHPAPYRCDLCGNVAEPPWWTYVTPPGPGFAAEDPEWLVCDGCQPHVERRNLIRLLARSMDVSVKVYGIDRNMARAEALSGLQKFLSNVDPKQTRRG